MSCPRFSVECLDCGWTFAHENPHIVLDTSDLHDAEFHKDNDIDWTNEVVH